MSIFLIAPLTLPSPPKGGRGMQGDTSCYSSPPLGGEVADERCEEAGEGVNTGHTRQILKYLTLILFTTLLTGCGFQPLMTGQSSTPQKFNLKIRGAGYSAYKFRRDLEKQLALTPKINEKAYVVDVSLSEGFVPIAYGTDATISRSQVQATASYTIYEGTRFIAKGNARAYSSYILNYTEEFSTRSSQAAASERTLLSLAEELSREIMFKIRSTPEKDDKKEAPPQEDLNW